MPDSLLRTLYSLLDAHAVGAVADSLGTSKDAALQGLKAGIAAVLGGMLGKAEDPNVLLAVLQICPKRPAEVSLSEIARNGFDSNSLTIAAGRDILSALFGTSQTAVTDAVGAASGLPGDQAARVLAMSGLVVTSFIANRVRTGGMRNQELGRLVQMERGIIRSALPRGLEDLLWPAVVTARSPLASGSVERERHAVGWIPLLAVIVLIPALIWLFSHARRVANPNVPPTPRHSQTLGGARRPGSTDQATTGTANRVETDPVELVKGLLVNRIDLRFDTGSVTLRPESKGQLEMIASTIATYPDVHLTLTGHTDNTGDADANRRLSRRRADTVMAELVRKGVPTDHLSSESQDEQGTVADNSTEEGRAKNRCVTVDVSQH